MEKQPSTRHGALEKLKSFRGIEKQRSFKFLSMEKQQSFKRNKDSPGKRGDTALHLAARAGSVAHVQKIFADCDPEIVGELAARQNQDGETALYVSAEKGHVDAVCEILKACDVHSAGIKANNSFDAFHIAAKQGHLAVCVTSRQFVSDVLKELLQAFPALAMTTNSVNATALDTAATQGHIDIVNLLLETDASLARIARNNGKTVLHSAARMGHVEIVQTLISVEGIEINAVNRAGETAFAIAEKLGNEELANILREAGGVTAKEQVNPPSSTKQLKQTVSDIRHDVQSQIKQTRQTKMHFHKIKRRIQKLHIGGLNNAISSNTVVAVLIATVAFAAIFQLPVAFIALTYVVVGRDDEWLAWCTMAIGTVIMLATLGSMCYCIIMHRMEEKNMRKIRRTSTSHSWSISVDSDTELLNTVGHRLDVRLDPSEEVRGGLAQGKEPPVWDGLIEEGDGDAEASYSDTSDPISRRGNPSEANLDGDKEPTGHASTENNSIRGWYYRSSSFSIDACFHGHPCYQYHEHEYPRCQAWPEDDVQGMGRL
ncbi:hypothetical protein PR202_ga16354 [Eleusine coracana subsp. coracana]|uniref:PGG domain-containing protein n=1 Tax=Eleusine coracana subsp. coracana TaxID=191504 RepID=A0AAV5CMD5_ELECO|nr:hypothetical protein PR202_ga16354 [Eleusine coracana subsp. coracana]